MSAASIALGMIAAVMAGPSADDRTFSMKLGSDNNVDLAILVRELSDALSVEVEEPTTSVTLPLSGLAGAMTRSLIRETLGAEVQVRDDGHLLRLIVPLEGDLDGRLNALSARVTEAAAKGDRFGFHARKSFRPDQADRPTVCLIHGINSSSYSFVHMVRPLEEAGFGVVLYDFPYNRDLDLMSRRFEDEWRAFRRETGDSRPWAIVTHSMGALLARSYVEGVGFGGDVSRLVMVGPPNRGAASARGQAVLQWMENARRLRGDEAQAMASLEDGLGEAAEDLLPGSDFLKTLNSRPRRTGVAYHILAGSSGFLRSTTRDDLDAQYRTLIRNAGPLRGVLVSSLPDLPAVLREVSDGTGDGVVEVTSTRLEGVDDHRVIEANHVELIRGPLLYPDPGPVACLPFVLESLGVEPTRAEGDTLPSDARGR